MALKTFNALDPTPPIKRFIAPLLRRRKDLAIVGRWLILKPLTHYTPGIYFDRRSTRGSLIPIAMVLPLYECPPEFRITVGTELKREHKAWDLREIDGETELCDAIEHRALPLVEHVTEPEAFLRYLGTLHQTFDSQRSEALCHLVLGNVPTAETMLSKLADQTRRHAEWLRSQGDDTPEPTYFRDLLDMMRRDPQGLIRQMHEWEAGQVRLMKLEKHWQPTPFPCERRAA